MQIERRVYSKQFKDEAIQLVLHQGYTCQKAADQLGVPPKTLAYWVRPLRKERRSGLLHHNDRGVQYCCGDYQQLLLDNRINCSMSRTGNCYDNAAMESFWGTLKQELIYQESYPTWAAAKQSIFEDIEVFYNHQRRHSAIGYVNPESFEASLN